MKILYDHQIFSFQKYGGVSRYFYEISNRIANMGQKVEIYAPLYVNSYFRNDSIVRPRGLKIPFSSKTRLNPGILNSALSKLVLKPRKEVNIFHETYYSMVDCCPISAKRVLTVHDMIHEKFPELFLQTDKTRQIKTYAIRQADHIICVSENTRRDLIELHSVPKEKTSVIYHGYPTMLDNHALNNPVKQKKTYILYVGKRDKYKNFDTLLRAYAGSQLLKSEFQIICFGGRGFSSLELSLMASLNISRDRVIHMGGPDSILSTLYSSAIAFVYPSLYEGFGIPPLAAMSFGCPVVCSNNSSLPEVVGDAAELFNPLNDSEMRTAIEHVVSRPERAKLLIGRGYERIKKFSWTKCAQQTLKVYNDLLRV